MMRLEAGLFIGRKNDGLVCTECRLDRPFSPRQEADREKDEGKSVSEKAL